MFGREISRNIREFRDGDFSSLRPGEFVDQNIVRVMAMQDPQRIFKTEDKLVQNECAFPGDRVGGMKLYETFYRSNPASPYKYMGLCERFRRINRSPKKAARTFIISQFHAERDEEREFNIDFARTLAWTSYCNGELPVLPHLYFPQFSIDEGTEREWGIEAGYCMMSMCDWVYAALLDGRVSDGMKEDIEFATLELGLRVDMENFDRETAIRMINMFKESRA